MSAILIFSGFLALQILVTKVQYLMDAREVNWGKKASVLTIVAHPHVIGALHDMGIFGIGLINGIH